MKSVYSVKQVNEYIQSVFREDFFLKHIYVGGEVSNCKYHSSGHIYFTLKDQGGAISCVMYRSMRKGLSFELHDGDKIVVNGSVDVYARGGVYQLNAQSIALAGNGALYLQFEQLKKELQEMGMFAAEYKKPIPQYAFRIGVVTAPTGAAVRDIIQIAKRRNPYVEIILYPALVQGDGAVDSICRGIEILDTMHMDVIIVGRGGGSIEDLWAFNEETVARAIFQCQTPVISAVGHETDTTIADYVADMRAPTPSAAAELAVFEYQKVKEKLRENEQNFLSLMIFSLEKAKRTVYEENRHLKILNPMKRIQDKKRYAGELRIQLEMKMRYRLTQEKNRLAVMSGKMEAVSPLKKFAAGYAYLTDENNHHIVDISDMCIAKDIQIFMQSGTAEATVKKITLYKENRSEDGGKEKE